MPHIAPRLAAALAAVALALPAASTSALAQQAAPAAATADSTPPDSARLALARQLMDAMQVGPAMLHGLEMGIATQKAMHPNIPEVFWQNFDERAKREMPTFVDSVAPIYAARFSAQELRELIAFYHTPVGHHLAVVNGPLSEELMRAGQRWGVELGADTMKELAAKGIVVP